MRDRGRHGQSSRAGAARHAEHAHPDTPPSSAPAAARGAGQAADTGPITGVQALDIFGAVAQPVEPVGPFGPAAPLERPPREQSRLVVLILAGLVLVLGSVAVARVFNFDPSPLLTGSPGDNVPSASGSAGAASSTTSRAPSSTTTTTTTAGAPVRVTAVTALDPQGDGSENDGLAKNVADGDPSTSWHSDRYQSPTFGGIKKGLGLVLDLGGDAKVTRVTVTAPGDDGAMQLRASQTGDLTGSRVLATARIRGGHVVLAPATPASTRYLVLWFTRVPQTEQGRRIVVDEVVVR